MHSPSITESQRASTESTRGNQYRTPFGTRSATTASTSCWMMARQVPFGGRARTSGSDSSMLLAWNWRRFTAASPASRSMTTVSNTCLSPAASERFLPRATG
jgi:hypothetical protein